MNYSDEGHIRVTGKVTKKVIISVYIIVIKRVDIMDTMRHEGYNKEGY